MEITGNATTQITIAQVPPPGRRKKPDNENALGFGRFFCDHMFRMEWVEGEGWGDAVVEQYAPLSLDPATLALHYGQTVFDGFKIFRSASGGFNVFRPYKYLERLNLSADRLSMPPVEPQTLVEALKIMLSLDHEWAPRAENTALYVRPLMFASEPFIGVKSSSQFTLVMFLSPVGAYYPEGFAPVKIRVCGKYARAGRGGLGAAKTPANYAASILAAKEAREAGYSQVLWLDSCESRYVEEVGAMNIFFKIGGKVVTPSLNGSILAGVTRDSVIRILESWGISVEERRLSMEEVTAAHATGQLDEAFGSGTAAVIAPVGALEYEGRLMEINEGKTGPLAQRLFTEITAIQYGKKQDPFGWNYRVEV
ncbi:MAG: branched-chain amino acid aminotransferase [Nitrospinae bacterium]|nr:branched-chain amino acid aminotransferase [Nitrospinota bacterium]